MPIIRRPVNSRGQALVETALVLPIFLALVFATIVFGLWLFYQQSLTTVAREGARYAAVHSASSNCPVGGWLEPAAGAVPDGAGAWDCDAVDDGWPALTDAARGYVFGIDPSEVHVTACWSGYHDNGNNAIYDAGPYWANDANVGNPWFDCTMDGGIDPITDESSLDCPATTLAPSAPGLLDGDDQASNLAVSDGELAVAANRVVVYACFNWRPPLAGFLLIPEDVVIRSVYSEAMQHQR